MLTAIQGREWIHARTEDQAYAYTQANGGDASPTMAERREIAGSVKKAFREEFGFVEYILWAYQIWQIVKAVLNAIYGAPGGKKPQNPIPPEN